MAAFLARSAFGAALKGSKSRTFVVLGQLPAATPSTNQQQNNSNLCSTRSFASDTNYKVHPSKIRDFAIIAHIDHGKTTMMDRLLAHCGKSGGEERVMDSGTLEKERGITILSKYTSFMYKGHLINAVDTPGHADFGGEVERVLGMVDGAVLLVDASEGPLAQTKFVLEKALQRKFRPIVVLNKVDRDSASPERTSLVESQLFDLFASLGATDEQLDFPVLYASAKQGWATTVYPQGGKAPPGASMAPLLDLIVQHVPPPPAPVDKPFSMCVAMIERDPYIGRIATGRVCTGSVRVGDKVKIMAHAAGSGADAAAAAAAAAPPEYKVLRIMKRVGMEKVQLDEAVAGDVVSIAPGGPVSIADTIAAPSVTEALDPGHIDPPTLSMVFGPNDSPLAGRSGKAVTGRVIGDRLLAEAETSVSLRVRPLPGAYERYEVQARGELQLSILIETMRREGMELAVSPPRVLIKEENGVRMEPIEDVMCEVEDELAGQIIEALSQRKGELLEMLPTQGGKQRLRFLVPSRGMIGFKSAFVNMTRGEGIMARAFLKYDRYKGPLDGVRKGVMVSIADGRVTNYALGELQSRGVFFVQPGADVYNGMLIGEHARDDDLEVNAAREKKLTNVRSVQSDDKIFLTAPRLLTLEDAIGYVGPDELIEVTPGAVRLRKDELDAAKRRVKARQAKNEAASRG